MDAILASIVATGCCQPWAQPGPPRPETGRYLVVSGGRLLLLLVPTLHRRT